jgi:hypothetical protein
MNLWIRFRSWTTAMLRSARMERDMDEEMRFHIEARAADLMSRGVSQQEALRQARLEFGGLETTKEECRDAVGVSFLETLFQDVRHGLRAMLRMPAFTAIAVIVLALGIGATTAIFSVVDAVLLRPLAYRDSGRLVTILIYGEGPVSVANYIHWRDQSQSFSAMSAADYWSPNLTGIDAPEHVAGLKVTENLFPMLGIEPILGRLFVKGEDKDGADREVILSYRLWQRRFSGDRNVLGKPIVLDGNAYVVVGVMPQRFQFAPFWATKAELWVPNAFGARIHDRGGNSLRIFARLKEGVSLTRARSEMASITSRLEQQYPGSNRSTQARTAVPRLEPQYPGSNRSTQARTAVPRLEPQCGCDPVEGESCRSNRDSSAGLTWCSCLCAADHLRECGAHVAGTRGDAPERNCREDRFGGRAQAHRSPISD